MDKCQLYFDISSYFTNSSTTQKKTRTNFALSIFVKDVEILLEPGNTSCLFKSKKNFLFTILDPSNGRKNKTKSKSLPTVKCNHGMKNRIVLRTSRPRIVDFMGSTDCHVNSISNPQFQIKMNPNLLRTHKSIIDPITCSNLFIQDAFLKWKNPVFKPRHSLNPSFIPTKPEYLSTTELSDIKFIAQVDYKFLVCKFQTKLIILDQHAVSERVCLEKLLLGYENYVSVSIRLELTQRDIQRLFVYKAEYLKWGVEFYSSNVIKISKILEFRCIENPVLLYDSVIQHLAYLESGGLNHMPKGFLHIIHSIACRSAIMFGDVLDDDRVHELLEQWKQTELPFQCAHGRPSFHLINI